MNRMLSFLCTILLFAQCSPDGEDPFLIGADRVGKLKRSHRLPDLDQVYLSDSVVQDTTRMNMGRNEKIEVYEKGGKHLLTLTPDTDSLPGIENIRIRDPRYRTPEGISLESTFGEIEEKYEIRKVVSTSGNILVLLKDNPLYFTISRDELPASLRYSGGAVDAVQIPDAARIKYMMVGWE